MSVQQTITLILCLAAFSVAAAATNFSTQEKSNGSTLVGVTKEVNYQTVGVTKQVTPSWSYNDIAIVSTSILIVVVGVAVTVVFIWPMAAYRICYTLGGCQNTMDAYVDRFIGNELAMARNVRSRSKRTVEYIEPILVTLAQAYEKYADDDEKKNFKIPKYYTK